MPRFMGEKNGLLAAVEIALDPHCVQKRILRSNIANELRRQFYVCDRRYCQHVIKF